MTTTTYAADRTALLIAHPYTNFMSEGGKLYDKMLALYPDRADPGSLWGSARAVKGGIA